MKEQLKIYIKGLLEVNKVYKENGFVLSEDEGLYSTKWLEDRCIEILAIINGGDDKE